MNSIVKTKLANLPKSSGVYFFKNASGEIIYIGKASILQRRVKSYFKGNHRDIKTPILVKNIADVDWITTSSEIEALFLEAEFIKRHKPVFNVDLKDDKNFIYIKVAMAEQYPYISLVRRPTDDKSKYFGPFVAGYQVKQALRYMRRIFPYYTKPSQTHSSKLEYQIGIIPTPDISKEDYRRNITRLVMIFEGKTSTLLAQLEGEMKRLSKAKQYELASEVRNQYLAIKALGTKMVFGREETFDLTLDTALNELTQTLGLAKTPRRIECYDISNFAGGDSVSSMIVFTDGVPDHAAYRHFKMHTAGPNDFAMMAETLRRRFSTRNASWPKPDLIIVDGGKGQLSAARKQFTEDNIRIPIVGLAKRYETIVQHTNDTVAAMPATARLEGEFIMINFLPNSPTLHLLQRIRDEAHRFAVSYHKVLRKKRTQSSVLEDIPGVGPVTRKRIIRHFGSAAGAAQATEAEIAEVVGPKTAKVVLEYLQKSVVQPKQ
jgi:excinuclease ABC subunit C